MWPAYVFFIGVTLIDALQNCPSWFLFLFLKEGLLVTLIDCVVVAIIPRCYKDVCVNNFFPCTARLRNSLPIKCFPLTYNLNGFKSRINKHLLTVSFL